MSSKCTALTYHIRSSMESSHRVIVIRDAYGDYTTLASNSLSNILVSQQKSWNPVLWTEQSVMPSQRKHSSIFSIADKIKFLVPGKEERPQLLFQI